MSEVTIEISIQCRNNQETIVNSSQEKSKSAVWTSDSVFTLLKLYESKLEMLEHPKKKTRIWIAISDSLKDYNIEMSPDQVRWKINALTKRYKQCIYSGQYNKFKYYKELRNIFAHYELANNTYYTMFDVNQKKNCIEGYHAFHESQIQRESKAVIELRKKRLADKIDADVCQRKIKVEKQLLEYLRLQEECKRVQDAIFDKSLNLREEKLNLRKIKLEMQEDCELRRLHLKQKEQEEITQLEREKCEMFNKYIS